MRRMKQSPAVLSVPEIIEQLGGGVKVAAELGIKPSAISNWKADGKFPPGRASDLAALAEKRGRLRHITLAAILQARA